MEKGLFKAVSETNNQLVVGNLIQDIGEDGEVLVTVIRDRETGVRTYVYEKFHEY